MRNESHWHKATYSGGTNACVEVRENSSGADVRDTQHRHLGYLHFSRAEWVAFLYELKH
ncbi:DUF397 domain-containing protein [Marinactinospora rubrisoli]|uniref:DUF397 domain-containing protein n=1 Tax=Marinactinospora rubrisoli TaxID=2715399 RepID=A0ABW2KGB6_9ACTN